MKSEPQEAVPLPKIMQEPADPEVAQPSDLTGTYVQASSSHWGEGGGCHQPLIAHLDLECKRGSFSWVGDLDKEIHEWSSKQTDEYCL